MTYSCVKIALSFLFTPSRNPITSMFNILNNLADKMMMTQMISVISKGSKNKRS